MPEEDPALECDNCGEVTEECVCYQTKDVSRLGQMLDQAAVLFGLKDKEKKNDKDN